MHHEITVEEVMVIFSKFVIMSLKVFSLLRPLRNISRFISKKESCFSRRQFNSGLSSLSWNSSQVKSYSVDNVPESSITFDKNPDEFGTLSNDRKLRRIVEKGDEEDEEVEETNYIDGVKGKTRLKPVNYAMMIKHHLNQNRLSDALEVLEKTMLIEHNAKPDRYIYNLLISGCARHGYSKKAFQLFNQMKKRGMTPRLSSYTSLFNACSHAPFQADSLQKARRLRDLMREKGVQPNLANYNAMIKAFGRQGDLETSFSIMDEMLSKNIEIDGTTFNFLLQASVSDKEAGFRHALLVWRKMLDKKVLPSTFSFNLLLRSARDCKLGDKDSTRDLFSRLLSSPAPHQTELLEEKAVVQSGSGLPNLLLPLQLQEPSSLVSVTAELDKPWHRLVLLGSMEGVLGAMDACRAAPDIKTFSLLLNLLPNSDEVEEKLLSEMKKRKIQPDIDIFNMLIKKRNSSSRFASALRVLDLLREYRLKPTIMTYGVLAMGCNTLESARQLVRDIEETGYRCNNEILTVLLRRARVSLDIGLVAFVLHTLRATEGIRPDPLFMENLKNFRDAVILNLELKENGRPHIPSVNSEGFTEKFRKLLTSMEEIEKQVEDPSAVHPWAQFKASKTEQKSSR